MCCSLCTKVGFWSGQSYGNIMLHRAATTERTQIITSYACLCNLIMFFDKLLSNFKWFQFGVHRVDWNF